MPQELRRIDRKIHRQQRIKEHQSDTQRKKIDRSAIAEHVRTMELRELRRSGSVSCNKELLSKNQQRGNRYIKRS